MDGQPRREFIQPEARARALTVSRRPSIGSAPRGYQGPESDGGGRYYGAQDVADAEAIYAFEGGGFGGEAGVTTDTENDHDGYI